MAGAFWHWWALGGLLVIVEAFAPGYMFLWFGAAAGLVLAADSAATRGATGSSPPARSLSARQNAKRIAHSPQTPLLHSTGAITLH